MHSRSTSHITLRAELAKASILALRVILFFEESTINRCILALRVTFRAELAKASILALRVILLFEESKLTHAFSLYESFPVVPQKNRLKIRNLRKKIMGIHWSDFSI